MNSDDRADFTKDELDELERLSRSETYQSRASASQRCHEEYVAAIIRAAPRLIAMARRAAGEPIVSRMTELYRIWGDEDPWDDMITQDFPVWLEWKLRTEQEPKT